jgi:hypothetical protein
MNKPPCSSCPWRRDAPKRWDAGELRALFRECQDDGLRIMQCHQAAHAPACERPGMVCRGWLYAAGVAAVGVRLLLMTGRLKRTELGRPAGCPGLYRTFRAMLRANGVRAPERNRVVP